MVGANHIPGIMADWAYVGSAESADLHSDFMQSTPAELLHLDPRGHRWQDYLSVATFVEAGVLGGLGYGVYSFQNFWARKWSAHGDVLEAGRNARWGRSLRGGMRWAPISVLSGLVFGPAVQELQRAFEAVTLVDNIAFASDKLMKLQPS